jgi:hypothetical protein
MIMALGESGYREALPFLGRLAQRPLDATMVYVALGEAIVRLSQSGPSDMEPVLRMLRDRRHPMPVDGAFRAMAMLRVVPEPQAMAEILEYVSRCRLTTVFASGWRRPRPAVAGRRL